MDNVITGDVLSLVKKLFLRTDRLASQILAGEYKSAFKGSGLNFDSIREYIVGDDIRNIDWKVTAKMREPYVRQYLEERQLNVFLVLDISNSNTFGTTTKNKRNFILELAALLAFLAIKNNDKVGLSLFSDHLEQFLSPRSGRSQVFKIIREYMTLKPISGTTNLKNSLVEIKRKLPRNSVLFIISDFVDPYLGEDFWHEMKLLRRMHDITCISARDKGEFNLPNLGFIELFDPETGAKTLFNLNRKSMRDSFAKKQLIYQDNLVQRFKQIGVDFLDLYSNQDYSHDILKFFIMKEHRSYG